MDEAAAVARVLANPFRSGDQDAALAVVRALPPERAPAAARRGSVAVARPILFARAVAETRAAPDGRASLVEDGPIGARLGVARADVVRIANAAERCRRALAAIAGRSAALEQLRHDCWAACF